MATNVYNGKKCKLKVWIECILLLESVIAVVGQVPVITPPPPGPKPAVHNGIIYNLHYLGMVPYSCNDPRLMTLTDFRFGATIKDKRGIMQEGGPYKVEGNLELAPGSCLWIEPGTVFQFGPGFGMIINGTLIARGSPKDGGRIVMTKDPDASSIVGVSNPFPEDARLVDGNTTRDGRLELFYNGRWRGVCNKFVNYTKIDANVTCRHLGFIWGNFTYHSFARNKTDYMLYQNDQQVIGFECAGLRPDLAKDHWRGLDFYNATTEMARVGNLYYNRSVSWLEYLDIEYAGRDIYQGDKMPHGKGSISASPYVPLMNNVSVLYGAYDGMNLTDIRGEIHIANSTIAHNRGHGAFIKTAAGKVLINMTDVTNNWGDGVKMYMVNYTIHNFNRQFPSPGSFCRSPSLSGASYPMFIYEDIINEQGEKPAFDNKDCGKGFSTVSGDRLTLHFYLMERDPTVQATMTVYDGPSQSYPILASFPVTNGSFPQSITSSGHRMFIRFQYTLPNKPTDPKEQWCKTFYPCFRFFLEMMSLKGLDEDLRFFNSSASNNTGYGVNVQDMRSKVFLNSSVVSDNNYGAGVRIFQGAGEVAINNTRVERNEHTGVNITYAGGYQLVNNSWIIDNYGYGVITEYERLNRSRFEHYQKMEVVETYFMFNEWIGFRIGNYCKGGEILVNESYFMYNYDEAIEYLSCNFTMLQQKSTNFSLAYNTFNGNKRHGILMSPMINTIGRMTNNTFLNHTLGALRIDNGYDLLISRWYAKFKVSYEIFANTFSGNKGRYGASLRLTQNAPFQKLYFKFNKVTDNMIKDSSVYINPRNRANAPIIVSSSNVIVQRNFISNPESVRDMATHLVDPSVKILGDISWWGTDNHEFIYGRIFDRDDRYNLAEIEYFPVLKDQWLYGNKTTSTENKYRWPFARRNPATGLQNLIGGELDVQGFRTDPNIKLYHVDRDIFIVPGAQLEILPGTTLEFENSIGMVIHGRLKADGVASNTQIIFTLKNDPDEVAIENRTATVRLVDGRDDYEGRLEVMIDGQWGSVCKEGWIDENSVVVCQQLGLTFNPSYGRSYSQSNAFQDILLSRVTCSVLDTDLTQCQSVPRGQFSCAADNIVFLRCQPPTWSGVTIPAVPTGSQLDPTQIRHVVIERAGMLDYEEMAFTPALRIDYNFYKITGLHIRSSVSDGLNIKYSNPHTENLIEYSSFDNNLGNGILTRSPFLNVTYTTMNNNTKGGFVYDPFFTEYEALSVRNFIHESRKNYFPETASKQVQIGLNSMIFITSRPGTTITRTTHTLELSVTDSRYRITLQILDYNPLTDVELITIYDSDINGIANPNTRKWQIEKDLVDFPIVSTGSFLTIVQNVNGVVSGRLAFAAHSRQYSIEALHSNVDVFHCTMASNEQGIVTKHYNNPSNEKLEIFHRVKSETIRFSQVQVYGNRLEAMYVPSLTKYHENFIPTLEEMTRPEKLGSITYIINKCRIHNNGRSIIGDHNHVDFANNVWHWEVIDSEFRDNRYGGFEIELPRVNDINERLFHSVNVQQSGFFNNANFDFTINGYYARVTISYSQFKNNNCRKGLITIMGMEKELEILNNEISNNIAKYAVEMDMRSHSEYDKPSGMFTLNNIKSNSPGTMFKVIPQNTPTTYAIAVRGVQNVTLNRNLLNNPSYQYELVAGVNALSLDNKMDVRYNWWGKEDQFTIRRRIFDFDDWNSYSIANYFPQLTADNVQSSVSTGAAISPEFNLQALGGPVNDYYTLPYRIDPYYVVSDITVMPNAKLTIEPGTQIEFYPNVGILVLGQLVAKGLPHSRIHFRPVTPGPNLPSPILAPSSQTFTSKFLRLRRDSKGEMLEYEGFLELYNSSSGTWNIMCDNQFNKKTAEVACREMGYETVNVDVRFTHLYDHYIYGKPMYFVKEFWAYSYYCVGDENSVEECMKRINYNIQSCIQAANYTFIRCGKRNLPSPYQYWGNIRLAPSTYEEDIVPFVADELKSALEYIDIHGAGMQHGERVGALQATYVAPIINNINITSCLWNGIDVVAPRYRIDINTMNITGNLGHGINVLSLNGESQDIDQSSFLPLMANTIPYYLYGLVDICKMEKVIDLKNRLIVFYKYSETSVNCVKIVKSANPLKRVQLRFLQFNLYYDEFYRNTIEIFNGETVSQATLMGELTVNSSEADLRKRYLSSGDTLSVHIQASTAQEDYGFIAEIVTNPISGLTYPDDKYFHKFEDMVVNSNEEGAILYQNVGEVNPSLYVDKCWIENNGIAILNLTSPPILNVQVQNTKIFNFGHNFVNRNFGGMQIHAHTQSSQTLLRANITNNVFSFGKHGETLNISGHHFQKFYLYENFIYNNTAGDFRDTIHVKTVGMNFTFNVVTNNTGHHIIRTYSQLDTSATQEFIGNSIYKNNATALYRSVFRVGSGKPSVTNNYLINPESEFEMEANNHRKIYNGIEIPDEPINARYNWWGSVREGYINGKIWDNLDNSSLVDIVYTPWRQSNNTLIDGKCPPGWRLDENRCYRYMGAALPYFEAKDFCRKNQGYLADVKDRAYFIQYLLRLSENVYSKTLRVWVYAEVATGYCSAFQDNYVVSEQDCHRKLLPFVCEKDPYIVPPDSGILAIAIGVSAGVFGTALIIIIVLAILWKVKSSQRKEERFERQASMRSSIRSSMRSRSTMTMLSDAHSRKRFPDDKSSVSMAYSKDRIHDDELSVSGISLEERDRIRGRRMRDKGSHDSLNHSNGFISSRDRLDRINASNGSIASRDRMQNGHAGSMDRIDRFENGRAGSRDRLYDLRGSRDRLDSPRNSPRSGRVTRDTLSRSNKSNTFQPKETDANSSPGSTLDKKLLKQKPDIPLDQETVTDGNITDDGFSEHEFDDYTTNDESGLRTDDDASARNSFHPTGLPPRIENQIDSLRLPQINELPRYSSESSVDMTKNPKSMTSFQQVDSPRTPTNFESPPTPPPPYSGEIPLRGLRTMSPSLSHTSSNRPVPQPRNKPVPPPRPGMGSKPNSRQSSKDNLSNLQKHLSQGNLNYIEKRPQWLADQVRETSGSETESDTETETMDEGSYPIADNKGFLSSRESIPNTVRTPGYTPPYNSSGATDYNSPWKDSYTNPGFDASSSRGSRNMDNMDYLRDAYSNPAFQGSKENLVHPHHAEPSAQKDGFYNQGYQPDSYNPGYNPGSYNAPYENLPSPPPMDPPPYPDSPRSAANHSFGSLPAPPSYQPYPEDGHQMDYPVYRIPSQVSVPMSNSRENLPRDLMSMDYRMGSEMSIPSKVDGSVPDVSSSSFEGNHPALASMEDLNDSYRSNLPANYRPYGPPQDSNDYMNQSPRNLAPNRYPTNNGVLYLNNDRPDTRSRKPEPIETEI
ncbi:hypothetical protein FSP39_004063 [Pinctada imbricata]|uniref:SRCR domain-containing protein n=1 Tax=Pinctada imbricata TaxID=66713 RepID=A0AA88XVA9_PINIB|nr:hypothetical protein FSP39_004063 [Pinctada imbricata]